jgi:hypothetical protein
MPQNNKQPTWKSEGRGKRDELWGEYENERWKSKLAFQNFPVAVKSTMYIQEPSWSSVLGLKLINQTAFLKSAVINRAEAVEMFSVFAFAWHTGWEKWVNNLLLAKGEPDSFLNRPC